MDFNEADHIRELRSVIRRFAKEHISREAAASWDRDNVFPRDVMLKLAELGVFGLTVDEKYGGVGRDILATMVVIEELSRHSLAVAVPYIMATCYAGINVSDCGSEDQKQEFLPRIASGKLLFAYAWTEPDVGADIASVTTGAARSGAELVINGRKRFCSGAGIADIIYTLVRSGDAADRHRNLSVILVPARAAGIAMTPIDSIGMKGVPTMDVTFDEVRVPSAAVLGGLAGWNRGWDMIVGAGLEVERLEVAAIAVGLGQASLDEAWAYAHERRQFGKLIANFQSIRHKLAEMHAELQAARLLLYQAAWLTDHRRPCSAETATAKLFATEAAKRLALECQTIFGAYGYVRSVATERYVRDALLMPIIGGSSAIQKNNIYKSLSALR